MSPLGERQGDEAARGHRRGVVLGFTLAELMLLLLFCLLLVSAGILMRKDEEITALKDELADTRGVPVESIDPSAAIRLNRLFSALFPAGAPEMTTPEMDALWDELVLAKNAEQTLADQGVDTSSAGIAQLASQANALKQAGLADASADRLKNLVSGGGGAHDWPPIITLEDDGYSFARGSAEITDDFAERLTSRVAPDVADLLARYDVDTVEIVGHTDETIIHPTRPSNLDSAAIDAFWGRTAPTGLIPVDNAGLGLARAIAVAAELRASGLLDGARIIPLSAAQLVLPGDLPSQGLDPADDQGRRRIEIRIRRSNDTAGG